MRSILPLLIITLLNINCYLSDLEGYKHLEKHENDVFELYPINLNSSIQYDSIINKQFNIHYQFSIKRTIHICFFDMDDNQIPSSLIYLTSKNWFIGSEGNRQFSGSFTWDPALCFRNMRIKAYATSDIDTLITTFNYHNESFFHCNKGGVDSFGVNISFGNDPNILPIITPMQYLSFDDIDYSRNPIIITKFSTTLNKSFITLFTGNSYIDPKYQFVNFVNVDSLEKLNPVKNCYFYECFHSGIIDREALCSLWMKKNISSFLQPVHELLKGKQYLLVYPMEFYNNYLLFLLRVNKMTYSNDNSGNAECTLFVLN